MSGKTFQVEMTEPGMEPNLFLGYRIAFAALICINHWNKLCSITNIIVTRKVAADVRKTWTRTTISLEREGQMER